MKIKLDSRIKTLVENCVKLKQRSMFVIVGDRGRDRVADLHLLLSRTDLKVKPSVLWCYSKDLGFSSHKKKRMKQIKKLQQHGQWDQEVDDPFELFISSTQLRFCYYKDSHKVLGNTFSAVVLQDFEALNPNLLCRTVETVEGGGMIIILLKTMTSLKQLYAMTMDVHERYRTPSHNAVDPRFNERFILSLTVCSNCLVMDDEFNILNITNHPIEEKDAIETPEDLQLKDLKTSLEGTFPIGNLMAKVKTLDQGNVTMQIVSSLVDKEQLTFAITAARGRGKSAALGLAVSAAVSIGYSNILVTAPSPENLHAFFQFLFIGLNALGYEEHQHYEVQRGSKEHKKSVLRVTINKTHTQIIRYITVNSTHIQTDLLVIDEAAAIPLPFVKRMLGHYPVLMSSTVHGYEGTGRALSLKLFNDLKTRNLKQLKMTAPIRYSLNDPIEKWLTDLLCLEATTPYPLASAPPHPSHCSLYLVNRDTLFSFHRASELFLHKMMSLFVSSHYRNSPNDLQMISDAPSHLLFVLLGPIDPNNPALPDVLCAVQVALEGKINRARVQKELEKGKAGSGDLVPWTVSEYYQDASFGELTGARVIRIATHPDLQKMGYGTKALEELEKYFKKELFVAEREKIEQMDEDERENEGLINEEIKPKKCVQPLLQKLSESSPQEVEYLSVAYGLNQQLYKFWDNSGFKTVYIKQKSSDITGEYSTIMLKSITDVDFSSFYNDFKRRFQYLLGFEFKTLPAALGLKILDHKIGQDCSEETLQHFVSLYDLKRLEAFCKKLIDYHLILDLLPRLADLYFCGQLNIPFSNLQKNILIAIALQRKEFEHLPPELDLPTSQLVLLFNKIVKILTDHIRKIFEKSVEETIPKNAEENEENPTKHIKLSE
ncbi:unnamed protein product [Blepharisma stoltei]|uniref:RNA cytidine acetyltransferase n=1 Tax=Blepharisma stoltei TaxID=1481888 RepID=A0AAU9IW35_9CILI|nr:unnamed protein product [Blepharisma stoltei]